MGRFDLTDGEWAVIAPLLPGADGRPRTGRPRRDDRRVLDAIFHVLRSGCPWRDLPPRYGPRTTAYNRFRRWAAAGVWGRVFAALAARSPNSLRLIDATVIRAHQHSAGGKGGRRRTESGARAAVSPPSSTSSPTPSGGRWRSPWRRGTPPTTWACAS